MRALSLFRANRARAAAAAFGIGSTGYLLFREDERANCAKVRHDPVKVANLSGARIAPIGCVDGTYVTPWSCPTREEQLQSLQSEEEFDVLVIGGGCVGTGTALDAANRGLKVALVDADDFAAGTSSRSTKLIHGGIRYLEQAFFSLDWSIFQLVVEALSERSHMLNAAPYMNQPLPIMIPLYKWWQVPYMWAGCKLYDLVAGRSGCPPSTFIPKEEAIYRFPMLQTDRLKGALVYYDGQMNDSRLNLMLALTGAQAGATVANYVKVVELHKKKRPDGSEQLCGAKLLDTLTNKTWDVKAKCIVNATGPFSDTIRKMDDPEAEELIVPAAGVHVVLPDHFSPESMGLIVPKTKDGRVLFFLPWEGGTLCGTTDSNCPISMTPRPTEQEVNFILEEGGRYLDRTILPKDVLSAWSGIRPLVKDPKETTTSKLSREHVVTRSKNGLISIMGGKWTTYRKMAEDGVDMILSDADRYGINQANVEECSTLNQQLLGADRQGIVCGQKFNRITITLRNTYGLSREMAKYLTHNYGTRALQVAELAKERNLGGKLDPQQSVIEAEVVFAVDQEYAVTVVDFISRRTRLAFLNTDTAEKVVSQVTELMGKELGWDRQRKHDEVQRAKDYLTTYRSNPANPGSAHKADDK